MRSCSLFIALGCSHAGPISILNHVQEQTGKRRIHAITVGTHLSSVYNKLGVNSRSAATRFAVERGLV